MNLDKAAREFLIAQSADGRTAATLRWYRVLIAEMPGAVIRWLSSRGVHELERVTTNDLRLYIVWLRAQVSERTGAPHSESTTNSYIRALHRFFSWCAVEYDKPNPMKGIRFPKEPEQKPKAIDLEDVTKMLATCGEDASGLRNRALMLFLLDTGARAGGVCGLLVEDIDLVNRRARVTEKGGKERIVVFTAFTASALENWAVQRAGAPYFFYNLETFQKLTPDGLRRILLNIARRAKVTGRVNPHSFRHAFAREYLLAGGDLATLSKLMGHRDVKTTASNYAVFTDPELADRHEQFSPVKKLESKTPGDPGAAPS
mgnify:CR=1 FL=1